MRTIAFAAVMAAPLVLGAAALARGTPGDPAGDLAAAEAGYRAQLRRNPSDSAALAALRTLAARRPLQRESQARAEARAGLPATFHEHETTRFVVLSDADPAWTQAQAERLERTHHQFHRFFGRLGLEPWPLPNKLVCVLFADRRDYRSFAARRDDVHDDWIAGYYAPRSDRIVFYRGDDNPSVVEARAQLEEMRDEIDELARAARAAAASGRSAEAGQLLAQQERYLRHVTAESDRVDEFVEQVGVATVVHEAVHQLMFNTGLQSFEVASPVWIAEGLATAFETDVTSRAFGPDHDYRPRREEFETLRAQGRLMPLRDLVAMTSLDGAGEDRIHLVYHQSYGLVTWLARARRQQLAAYLDRLRRLEDEGPEPSWIGIFEESFGDVDRLERAWLRSG
jgi:hypothetical protein